ncbi:MAG: shikimate kinase AroK [Gammaproteobacteria bacterium]|nr:shikimate kinase AroK [Gammaproteobacteria bacterium]
MNSPENIYLIGPMGVGKSTIGRQLASQFKKEFIDLDHELEKRTGVSISIIFEIEGEPGFRKRESELLDELTQKNNIVLATGGGAILSEANRKILRTRGFVVYLRASIDTLVERTRNDRKRPLLQNGDKRQTIEDLLAVRGPIYTDEADLIVDTDNRAPATVAKEIINKVEALDTL